MVNYYAYGPFSTEREADDYANKQSTDARAQQLVKPQSVSKSDLTPEEKEQLISDFKEWSGGFDPSECEEDQVTVYIDYALSRDLDKQAASVYLYNYSPEV